MQTLRAPSWADTLAHAQSPATPVSPPTGIVSNNAALSWPGSLSLRVAKAAETSDVGGSTPGLYRELASYLEVSIEDTARFSQDEAIALLKYHRRQRERREAALELARLLDVPTDVIFEAVTPTGTQLLLDALRAQKRPVIDLATWEAAELAMAG